MKRLIGFSTCVLMLIALAPRDAAGSSSRFAPVPHVFIIVMENKEQSSVFENRQAPYINSLIRQYGYATDYYGVTHPSLPNYVAMIAGDFFNTFDDSPNNRFRARNIVDQLEARRLTWKAYMENLPRAGYQGDQYPTTGTALYARKHDPFMLMTDVLGNPARLRRVVPGGQMLSDLKAGTVPNLSYIAPNLCHDMHGAGAACPITDVAGLIRIGDRYLSTLVPRIMKSPSWTGNSTIVIVWDEGESSLGCCKSPPGHGGGRIPAIIIAREGARGYTSRTPYNHYSLLRTLQVIWNLGCLANTCDTHAVRPMDEFLRSHQG